MSPKKELLWSLWVHPKPSNPKPFILRPFVVACGGSRDPVPLFSVPSSELGSYKKYTCLFLTGLI